MVESETQNREYQFSLRRLLLWTVVIAGYLGLAKSMNWDTGFLLISSLVVVIALLRAVAGTEAAAIGSLVGCGGGLLLFLLIECVFLIIDRLDTTPAHERQHFTPVRQGLSASTGFRLALGALLVAILGSIIPIRILIELWQEPVVSTIRLTDESMVMLWCGLGTPVVVIWFCVAAVQLGKDSKHPPTRRLLFLAIVALSLTAAFLPLLLTTFGAKWVIQARSLWLEP